MTELRKPRSSGGNVRPHPIPGVPPPALVLVCDLVCDGCRWPERCRRDRLCWREEKKKIAEERLR